MKYNYNLYSNTPVGGDTGRKNSLGKTFIPARVHDIILDDSHPEWVKLGKSEAIGAIKYSVLSKGTATDDSSILPAAFPLVNDFKKIPLKNEIVLLLQAPSYDIGSSKLNKKIYYASVVNLWNHPNHGGYPETDKEFELGDNLEELTDVNPLQPYPGDIIMDGRQGQSLRFSGYPSSKNIFTDNSNNGKPITILSNGQKQADTSFEPIVEDVNEDDSSIYLTSDHKVPLEQAVDFTEKGKDSYGFNKVPLKAGEYKGSQIILNGGRLFFNAKEEGIFLNSKKYIDFQSDLINFNAKSEVSIEAELINLGQKTANSPQSFKEPVLLGHQTAALINSLISIIQSMSRSMTTARTSDGKSIPSLNKRGVASNKALRNLKRDVSPFGSSPLKSKKVFTE